MEFDAQRAYDHIKQLAFPRAVGSDGELKARDYIVSQLSALGLCVEQEAFRFTKFPAEVLPRLISTVFTAVVIVACLFGSERPVLASLLCVSSLIIALALTRWQKSLEWLYNVGSQHTSKNIVATQEATSDIERDLIFVAHYDSKSQVLPIAVRALCYCIGVIGLIVLTLMMLLQIRPEWRFPSALIWAVGGCICLCLTILAFNFTQNRSPGAFDNASGVGVLLELARCFSTEPPRSGIRITYLSPGAEEFGMCGAVRYIQRHGDRYDSNRTYVINFDGVGAIGKMTLITRYGLPPVVTSQILGRLIVESGVQIGADISEVYSPVGVGYDGIPIGSRGLETVTLSAGGFGRAALKIHSPADGLDLIDRQSLQRVGDLMTQFVHNATIHKEKRRENTWY